MLAGGAGTDALTGGNNVNQKDLVFGNNSGDTLQGRMGSDLLVGGLGDDALNGGDGNDTLVGGDGRDVLNGGLGNDTFVFSTALNASTNVDSIVGMQASATDTIWLSKLVYADLATAGSTAGTALQAGEFASVAGASASVGSNVHVIFDTSTGNLYYDANGGALDGRTLFAQVDLASLSGTVDASDFRVGP